ncbi:AHH domain-containing protein [Photobacterium nomapromontoriensis]|uniref:AHH domain-containing protein n=1 Tax=Photobacterium nomapromontoriensis TaxID=2910237 RepID=UPI003D0C63F1
MLAAQVQIQTSLTEYRESNKEKSPNELKKEPHHPTTVLSRNLTAIGEPKPSTIHDPHHIVMGTGRFRKMQMMLARLNLHVFGIGINDPINGVWLPRTKADKGHWASPLAPAHKEIHRYNYETWITSLLSNDSLPESVYVNRLRSIKNKLKTGTYPTQIIEKKTLEWKGE